MAQVAEQEKSGKIIGPLELRKMARSQFKALNKDLAELRAKINKVAIAGADYIR